MTIRNNNNNTNSINNNKIEIAITSFSLGQFS